MDQRAVIIIEPDKIGGYILDKAIKESGIAEASVILNTLEEATRYFLKLIQHYEQTPVAIFTEFLFQNKPGTLFFDLFLDIFYERLKAVPMFIICTVNPALMDFDISKYPMIRSIVEKPVSIKSLRSLKETFEIS